MNKISKMFRKMFLQRKTLIFKRKNGSSIKLLIIMMLLFNTLFVFTPQYKIEPVKAAYTSYYVGLNGSDGNTGGKNDPWYNISYAWGEMDSGERLYIYGGTYTTMCAKYDATLHGTAAEPIIIEPFENDYVVITNSTYQLNRGLFTLYNQYHITFKDLHFNDSALHGIFLSHNNPQTVHNISIINCTFNNMSNAAIQCAGSVAYVRDCVVERCWINDSCNSWAKNQPGFLSSKNETISLPHTSHWRINDTWFNMNVKWSIDMKSNSSHMEVFNNSINTTHDGGHLGNSNKSAYGYFVRQAGGGVYVDAFNLNCSNISIYNNVFTGNKTGLQIGLEQSNNNGSDYVENVSVYNNVFNMTYDNISNGCLSFTCNNGFHGARIRDVDVFQNTFYDAYYGLRCRLYGYQMVRVNISNNIFSNHQEGVARDHANWTPLMYNNLFDNAGTVVHYGKASVNGSALYSTNGSNFRLQSSSDAIDTGTNTGITLDIEGSARPYNTYYDIGAYEYPSNMGIPIVSTGSATSVTTSTAKLHGTLSDSFGSATTLGFEYGYTINYGTSTTFGTNYVNLSCTGDAYTSYSNPNTNYDASGGTVYALYDTTYSENAPTYLNFSSTDITSYSSSDIVSADLLLYITDSYSQSRLTIDELIEHWDEDTVTYNTQPNEDSELIDSQTLSNNAYNTFNITPYIRDVMNGTETWHGLKIYDDDYAGGSPPDYSDWSFSYYGRTDSNYPPILQLTFSEPHSYDLTVSSLTLGRLYHYRSWGTNANGTGYGGNVRFVTVPGTPTNLQITSSNSTQISLSWNHWGTQYNRTVIRRSTTGYPSTPTSGTATYNGTGSSTTVTGLSSATTYYFRGWGYTNWNTLFKFSTSFTSASTSTNPQPPQNVATDVWTSGSLYSVNISWTKGTGADRTVIRKSSGAPPTTPQSGTSVYNGTGTYYNDTSLSQPWSYRAWSYNATSNIFSEYAEVNWSVVWIEVYDENTSTAITGYTVFFTNQSGTETYTAHGCSNPHLVNVSEIPIGENILLRVNATWYNTRFYYFDIEGYGVEYITCYLTPSNGSNLYYITVRDELGDPLIDVDIVIKRVVNDTYEDVTSLLTDSYGQVNVYLVPENIYKINLSKDGYQTHSADWIPDPDYYGIYYPKIFILELEEETADEPDSPANIITFNGYISGNILYVNYTDALNLTLNSSIHVYEINITTGNETLITWVNYTTNDSYQAVVNASINSSNSYRIVIHYNHSRFGYQKQQFLIQGDYTRLTNPTQINVILAPLGIPPMGWSNLIMWCLLLAGCMYADNKDAGLIMILLGGLFLFINYFIGFNTTLETFAGGIVPTLFIISGIMITWNDSRKKVSS